MKKVFLFLIFVFLLQVVSALESGYCVKAEVTDINPSSVNIDEEFTVGVQVENCGEENPGFVEFEIINPSKHIAIKEPLLTEISSLGYANSERFLLYHMRTSSEAKAGEYVLNTKLRYGDEKRTFSFSKEYNISITVIGEEAELGIASVKTNPVLPYEGDTVELTMRIENYGDGTANSVRVKTEHEFKGVRENFIGTLDAEEDGPAVFTFIASEAGEFELPVEISYQDDFGKHTVETSASIIILERKVNWGVIVGIIIILVLVSLFVYYYFRNKKEKNKIIQQLLEGNNHEHKKVKKKKR